MQTLIECPFCPGEASLVKENIIMEFRKEKFPIIQHFYKCSRCKEEFSTTESDEISISQLYNQYRAKHKIPFPTELRDLRERYGLSAAKMSEVLGLGINTYSNYEGGEIPSLAVANLIRTVFDHRIMFSFVNQNKELLGNKLVQKVASHISQSEVKGKSLENILNLSLNHFYDEFNGFSLPNEKKISELLKSIVSKSINESNDRIKLNKCLFYIDFYHYKSTGNAISGMEYRAIPYGPVPAKYDVLLNWAVDKCDLLVDLKKTSVGNAIETFRTMEVPEESVFCQSEMNSINFVMQRFERMKSWDIMQLSHKEQGWIDNYEKKDLISFQKYAFSLRGV